MTEFNEANKGRSHKVAEPELRFRTTRKRIEDTRNVAKERRCELQRASFNRIRSFCPSSSGQFSKEFSMKKTLIPILIAVGRSYRSCACTCIYY